MKRIGGRTGLVVGVVLGSFLWAAPMAAAASVTAHAASTPPGEMLPTTLPPAGTATVRSSSSLAPWGPDSVAASHPDPAPARWKTAPRAHASGTIAASESTNWAGLIDTGAQFSGIGAQWTVPTVQASAIDAYSSTWIGIDGVTNTSLIQVGTDQDSVGGVTVYYAWYEILPSPEVVIGAVSPGDEMQASIVNNSGTWTIDIVDVTSGRGASGPVPYSGPGSSAEWIEEAPSNLLLQVQTLADFGSVSFSDLAVSSSVAPTLNEVDMVDGSGNVIAYPGNFGTSSFTVTYQAPPSGPPPPAPPSHGYWLVGADGGIFSFGSAQFFGSTGSLHLQRPVVGITPTADRSGYWLVATDGGTFAFGDAAFYGSIPGLGIAPAGSGGNVHKLASPIVGMVPSADGKGYFMVGADGGVFAFGDARFAGSCPGIGGCAGTAVAVMPDNSGDGYWVVTTTGNVYAFGDAAYYGAPGPQSVPVTSAVRSPDGRGYWILFANGAVSSYGDAVNRGAPVGLLGGFNPAAAIFTTADGGGYWVAAAAGGVYAYGDAPNEGGLAGQHLNAPIIAATGW